MYLKLLKAYHRRRHASQNYVNKKKTSKDEENKLVAS